MSPPSQPLAVIEEVERYRHGSVPRAVRERQILALAGQLFAERGYDGASMDELASRVGVSKPIIYKLFGSKRGVFGACAEELGQELTAMLVRSSEGAETTADLIRSVSTAWFTFINENGLLWRAAFSAGTPVAEEIDLIRSRQAELVALLVNASAEAEGLELIEGQAEAMAYAINGSFEGLAVWFLDHPETEIATLVDWAAKLVVPPIEALSSPVPK